MHGQVRIMTQHISSMNLINGMLNSQLKYDDMIRVLKKSLHSTFIATLAVGVEVLRQRQTQFSQVTSPIMIRLKSTMSMHVMNALIDIKRVMAQLVVAMNGTMKRIYASVIETTPLHVEQNTCAGLRPMGVKESG